MTLKSEIVGSCGKCLDGFIEGESICECMEKFRVYNRLINGGFFKNTLDIVYDNYEIPFIESGEEFLEKYLQDLVTTESKGLSLFIYSKDRGRGKTTLAHYIMSRVVRFFSDFSVYNSERSYAFEDSQSFQESLKDADHKYLTTWYVLDDLGNEASKPAWKKEEMISGMQKMLQFRRNKHLPTIITSNYSPDDLGDKFEGVLNSLLEITPGGEMGGQFYRSIRVGGAEDLRLTISNWED